MKMEKIKILEASYNQSSKLIKIRVETLDTEENAEKQWGLTEESFDSLINQITKKNLQYNSSQREILCKAIVGVQINNKIKIDMNEDCLKLKNNLHNITTCHDVIDMYPFYELQKEMMKDEE